MSPPEGGGREREDGQWMGVLSVRRRPLKGQTNSKGRPVVRLLCVSHASRSNYLLLC